MSGAGTDGAEPRFRLWLRRRDEARWPYSIRFEVIEGKGILRVVRPGVLVDPPARPAGFEERLSASQVRASRFLHVWDGGRHRQGHLLARIDEAALESLPMDRWIELAVSTEGTTTLLVLPKDIGPDSGIVDDEPTWPHRDVLAGVHRELRDMGPSEEEFLTEVRGSPVASTAPAEPTGFVAYAEPGADVWLDAFAGDGPQDEDRTVRMSGSALASALGETTHAPRPVPPRLPLVLPPDPAGEHTQIEAFEAAEALEALESTGDFPYEMVDEDEFGAIAAGAADDDDDMVVVDDIRSEDTDVGKPSPLVSRSSVLTEAVTVMPLGAQELAADAAGRVSPNNQDDDEPLPAGPETEEEPLPDANRVSVEVPSTVWRPAVKEHPSAGSRSAAAPVAQETSPAFGQGLPSVETHERNTTLVRHLRRRIASDRVRIAALEQQVGRLEAELARRD